MNLQEAIAEERRRYVFACATAGKWMRAGNAERYLGDPDGLLAVCENEELFWRRAAHVHLQALRRLTKLPYAIYSREADQGVLIDGYA